MTPSIQLRIGSTLGSLTVAISLWALDSATAIAHQINSANKNALISAFEDPRVPLSEADSARAFEAALADPDPSVRSNALVTISTRVRMADVLGMDSSRLEPLAPSIARLLRDRYAGVRSGAISALMAIEYRGLPFGQRRAIGVRTASALALAYSTESIPRLRVQIIAALCLTPLERDNSIDRIGDKTIAKALTDSSSDVVALATRGVSNHQLVTALPQLGALLQHPLPAIRAAAARALESFDSKTSKQFIGALVKATTVETDPTAKKAITHAIYSISRQ